MGLGINAVIALTAAIMYALFAHQITLSGDHSFWSYAFALSSPILVIVWVVWASGQYRIYWLAAIVVALVTDGLFDWPTLSPPAVLLAQHAGLNACLASLFGLSLRPGANALVTRMAGAIHGALPPEMIRYTRQVTWAWTLFFITITVASLTLFLAGQPYWWSVLANILNMPLVILMFAAEYTFRLRHLPHIQHASVRDSLQAFNAVIVNDSARDSRH